MRLKMCSVQLLSCYVDIKMFQVALACCYAVWLGFCQFYKAELNTLRVSSCLNHYHQVCMSNNNSDICSNKHRLKPPKALSSVELSSVECQMKRPPRFNWVWYLYCFTGNELNHKHNRSCNALLSNCGIRRTGSD